MRPVERNYVCLECGKAYVVPQNLKCHMRGPCGDTIACPLGCGFVGTRAAIAQHMPHAHGQVADDATDVESVQREMWTAIWRRIHRGPKIGFAIIGGKWAWCPKCDRWMPFPEWDERHQGECWLNLAAPPIEIAPSPGS